MKKIKNLKIKSWVLTQLKKPLEEKSLKISELKEGQFLIKIIFTGFCASQYGEINGVKGKDKYLPHCLGHEAVGIVVSKNSKKLIFENDYVVLHWMKSSGVDCKPISYLAENNKKINSGMITTFGNYAVISENRITKINPQKKDLINYTLLGCSIPVGISTVEKIIKAKKNDRILLIGSGAIGLPIIHYCKTQKIKIDIIEIRNRSIKLAKIFGCNKVYRNIDNKSLIKNLETSFYDHVVDTSGSSKLIEEIIRKIKPKVNICLIGVAKNKELIKIDPMKINYGMKIVGSYGGDFNPDKDIGNFFNFLKKTKFKFNLYIDKVYDIKEMNNLVNDFKNKKIFGKTILKI